MSSFPLYLITSPEDFADEHILLEAMFARGLERLHVRKPRKDQRAMERWILELDPQFRSAIVVHGHADLVDAFALAGFHGNEGQSGSFHSFTEVFAASNPMKYGFLSPIFDSYSKPGYAHAFSDTEIVEGLSKYHSQTCNVSALIALGGIDAERLAKVRTWGFDGAALLGAIWNAASPLDAWIEVYQESFRICNLPVPEFGAIESWRDVLQHRRGGRFL